MQLGHEWSEGEMLTEGGLALFYMPLSSHTQQSRPYLPGPTWASGEGKVSQVEVQDPNGSFTLSR